MLVARYERKDFELPAEGVQRGKLIEVKNLGSQMTANGVEKERVRLVWQLDQADSAGRPLKVFESYNLSLHPQSLLSRALREITGLQDLGEEFDLDQLVGTEMDLVIRHNESNGKTYANVVAHLRPQTKAEARAEAAESQRVQAAISRVNAEAARPHTVASREPPAPVPTAAGEITDEDIPF